MDHDNTAILCFDAIVSSKARKPYKPLVPYFCTDLLLSLWNYRLDAVVPLTAISADVVGDQDGCSACRQHGNRKQARVVRQPSFAPSCSYPCQA